MSEKFDFDLLQVYRPSPEATKPEPVGFIKRIAAGLAGKFFMSLLVTMVVGMVTHFVQITLIVGTICATLAGLLGWKMEPPEKDKGRFESIVEKVKKVSGPRDAEADADDATPTLKEKITQGITEKAEGKVKKMADRVIEPVKEAAHDAKEKVTEVKEEAKEKVTEAKVEVKEKVEEVKEAVGKVGDKIGNLSSPGQPEPKQGRPTTGSAAKTGPTTIREFLSNATGSGNAQGPKSSRVRCPHCGHGTMLSNTAMKRRLCEQCWASYMPEDARRAAMKGKR